MSQPPGPPDPEGPRDPWATPVGETGPSPYQPPYQPPPQPGYPAAYGRPTNGKAQASLWTGIGLIVTSCCGLGLLGVIPVLLGVRARREIRLSGGAQGGEGMAMAGIVTGAIAIVLSVVALALWVLVFFGLNSGMTTYGSTGA